VYNEHGFNTTNFRSENMDHSRMYKPSFSRGRRCVLVCEGFYENLRVPYRLPPEERSIYYIHAKQREGVEIHDKSTWNSSSSAVKLLYIAGIFDIWTDDDGEEIISFTILSMDSQQNVLSWLHPRTPVILESAYQIYRWLNFNELGESQALKLIKHPKAIEWHEVSTCVLDERNKDCKCNKPVQSFKHRHQQQQQRESDDDDDNED
jgi:putative SOS response-associated peptidase YedK